MTSVIERIISIIAPHRCLICSKEGNVICDLCFPDMFDESLEICFLCNKPSKDSQVCSACSKKTAIGHMWIAGTYDGTRKRLIRKYKFERVRAASESLARAIDESLPYIVGDVLIVPVPTAPERVRMRGYDHTLLLARAIARKRALRLVTPLRRKRGGRQVGASKQTRIRQAASSYELVDASVVRGRHVLLVDDVTTSGATMMAIAALMHGAGVAKIDAVVVAKHTLD